MTGQLRLEGRKALVTGGGSGIGRAVARRLAAEGAAVGVLDVRKGAAEQVASELAHHGAAAAWKDCDVRSEDQVVSSVDAVASELGGLDIAVTCAGISISGTTSTTTLDDWNLVIGINLTGTFLTIRHALPHLCQAGSSSIVTIGSVASLVAAGRTASYDAAKAGVLQLTRSVAAEFADQGVRANCVCPGLIATDLGANSWEIARPGAEGPMPEAPKVRITPPISRRAAPEEVAAAVAFLCTDEASFFTGAAIPIDGGYTAI